jgi:hypothetical protein
LYFFLLSLLRKKAGRKEGRKEERKEGNREKEFQIL